MPNEITASFSLKLINGKLIDNYTSPSLRISQATAKLVRDVQSIATGAHAALNLGGVSTPGVGVFSNLDGTNFVDIGSDDGGTFHPFLRLKAGEQQFIRLSTNAPYALADTGAIDLFYIIYED